MRNLLVLLHLWWRSCNLRRTTVTVQVYSSLNLTVCYMRTSWYWLCYLGSNLSWKQYCYWYCYWSNVELTTVFVWQVRSANAGTDYLFYRPDVHTWYTRQTGCRLVRSWWSVHSNCYRCIWQPGPTECLHRLQETNRAGLMYLGALAQEQSYPAPMSLWRPVDPCEIKLLIINSTFKSVSRQP